MSLSPVLLAALRAVLLGCDPFIGNAQLRALFVDQRIRPWRDNLPEASARSERVDAIIDYLIDRRNQAGEPALWLLLLVLRDQTPPQDGRYDQLAEVAQQVRQELTAPASPPSQPQPTDKAVDFVQLYKQIAVHFDLQELDALCFHLGLSIEDLPGTVKSAKARELVTFMARRGRTAELIAQLEKERRTVDWR